MLISTRLDALGNSLRPRIKNIATKGVPSVRSPVCNLRQFNPNISHESFSSVVIAEFRKEYGINSKACVVQESAEAKNVEYIRKGMEELSTWDWAYGQTPEFTQTLNNAFQWGDVSVYIHSKRGLILESTLEVQNPFISTAQIDALSEVIRTVCQGKKYGFLIQENQEMEELGQHVRTEYVREVVTWLLHDVNLE